MKLTVEGVEQKWQYDKLSKMGCDFVQGYFFSKPVDLRAFDQLNHSMVQRVYQSNEYYPSFEDLENDLDLIAFMLEQTP